MLFKGKYDYDASFNYLSLFGYEQHLHEIIKVVSRKLSHTLEIFYVCLCENHLSYVQSVKRKKKKNKNLLILIQIIEEK